jgi:hypothetical protein
VIVAQFEFVGVNVYVVVSVLFIAGDHVPVMPLVDVVGNENVVPKQYGPTWAKVGVVVPILLTTTTVVS